MKIVAGTHKGAPLVAPKGAATRPTSERVREAIFNVLTHATDGPALDDATVIDLFAGTGALGLEALSRGAAFCLFVDNSVKARGILQQNIEALDLHGRAKVFRRDATALGPAAKIAPAQFAFLDPPYGRGLGERALKALGEGGWLAAHATIVLEEQASTQIVWPKSFQPFDTRAYGDTNVHFARFLPQRGDTKSRVGTRAGRHSG